MTSLESAKAMIASSRRSQRAALIQVIRSRNALQMSLRLLRVPIYRYGPGYFGCRRPDDDDETS